MYHSTPAATTPAINSTDRCAVTAKVALIDLLAMNSTIRAPRQITPPAPASTTAGTPNSRLPPAARRLPDVLEPVGDAADHGEVLRPGGALDLAADLRRALRVADHEEHPRQQQGGAEAERRAGDVEACRLRRRDDLGVLQRAVLAGEGVPGRGQATAAG